VQSRVPQANPQVAQPQQRPQSNTQSTQQPSTNGARSTQGAAPDQSTGQNQNQSQSTQSNQPAGTAQSRQASPSANTASQPQNNQAGQQGNQQQQPQQRSTQSQQAPQTQQQPNQQGAQTRQSSQNNQANRNQAAAVATTSQQRTQIATAIRQQNVSPVRANFNVAVGVAVPSRVRLSVLPDTIVSIVPQYRGYSYFVTGERVVIVEPSSHRIVEVLPYEGGSRTAVRQPSQRKAQFTSEQRASIKRHAASQAVSRERAPVTATTTGSGSSRRYVVEERVPREVELEEFDDVVVREVPAAQSYRYIRRDSDVIVVDPGDRRVIDIID